MDWYTAYKNVVIEEFAQRSMCALLEIFFSFAWRSLAAAAVLSTRVSYTLFFLQLLKARQSNPILLNVGLRARSKSLHARSSGLIKPYSLQGCNRFALVLSGCWGLEGTAGSGCQKTLQYTIGLVPVLGRFFIFWKFGPCFAQFWLRFFNVKICFGFRVIGFFSKEVNSRVFG